MREKNYNLEILRVIACLCVLLIHISNTYSRGFEEISRSSYMFSLIINSVSRIAVPIFFMLSGALLIKANLDLKKCVKRAAKFTIILIVWSALYLIWNKFVMDQTYDFTNIFSIPAKKHLWYLYALITIYIALPFVQILFANMSERAEKYFMILWFAFLTIRYVGELFEIPMAYKVPIVGDSCYLGYFVMGYFLSKYIRQFKFNDTVGIILIVMANAVNIGLTYYYSVVAGVHQEQFFQYRNTLLAFSSAIIFIMVYRKKELNLSTTKKKIINVISKNSFELYLVHILFLDIIKVQMAPLKIHSAIGIPVFFVMLFIVSFVAAVGVRKFNSVVFNEKLKHRLKELKISVKVRKFLAREV